MFQIGLKFDFAHLIGRNNRRAVALIASASMVASFALGFGFGYLSSPPRLFIATAFSIAVLPILGRIMMEFRITRLPIGMLLLALVTALALAEFSAEAFAINVGYDLGAISQQILTMLVLMAIFSTVITAPGLRRWLPKMGVAVAGRH
jgi:Kef-type K+ transport system membrane component KefB